MKLPPSVTNEARVRDAIEQLYRKFAGPVPATIEGCPCCIKERGVDILLSTPLHELTGQQLWSYVSGLFHTIGSACDFQYLLPRIFEVAVDDPENSNDPEIVLGKLSLAGWKSWSREKQDAILEFMDAWLALAIGNDVVELTQGWPGWETERVLCGMARAGLPLTRWLDRLREPAAAAILADFRERMPEKASGFWGDVPEGFGELLTLIVP